MEQRRPIVPGEVVQVSPLVRRLTAPNPGMMTGPGTNAYIVGKKALALIDPGPDDDSHLQAMLG
ncbi:MAG TPA: NUDIX hydrolase, partial [Burkholderiales bacterium]|nr:NUDIX hydrolase [Burkholderiales bacterium]